MAGRDEETPPHTLLEPSQGNEHVVSDGVPHGIQLGDYQSSRYSSIPTGESQTSPAAKMKTKVIYRYSLPSNVWALEIFAISLSFASFIAIIISLRIYQNRPQEAWPYNYLTLNGLIAFLSTITQSALFAAVGAAISQAKWTWYANSTHKASEGRPLADLATIDEASRGTMIGTLKLLWVTKGYHLVAIGAILTLMAVAFDTFVQQVLTVNFRNALITAPAEIAYFPRSEFYSKGRDIALDQVGSTGLSYTASVDMQAAIASGILADSVGDLQATCSTGNCTWPIIPTIAVCGACTNVTNMLNTTCDDSNRICSHQLPSGLELSLEYNSKFGLGSGNVIWFTSAPTSTGVYHSDIIGAGTNQEDEEMYSADPMYVSNFEAINIPYFGSTGDYRQLPTATQCALWFCMQAFNASTTSGRQTQNVTETWSKLDWLPNANDGGGIHSFVDIPPSFNVAPSSNFTIDKMALIGLQQSFNFSQSIRVVEAGNQASGYVSSPSAEGLWYGSQDWDAWIARLARSVSNDLRAFYAANLTAAPAYAGTTYATRSFISVRWPWLAYPAAMLLMGLFFFVATVWESHDRGVSALKDGPLTLLAARLEYDAVEDIRHVVDRPNGVAEACGSRKVLLANVDGLLVFRQVPKANDHA